MCAEIASKITKNNEAILSPYFDDDISKNNDGIGLFHDRIIFISNDTEKDMENVQKIFKDTKIKVAKLFSLDDATQEWFDKYLQFHAVVFQSNEKPIMDSAQYLDIVELEKTFPVRTVKNPILKIFDSQNRNTLIREKIRDGLKLSTWPLSTNGGKNNQSDMEDIIGKYAEKKRKNSTKKSEKSYSYYAIVQSDGDHFGKYIEQKEKDNRSREVSKQCLTFCSEASKIIQKYGGVTIYAGGDDLLFLAPLWEKPNEEIIERKNIITLLDDLRIKFQETFGKKDDSPTISFGVAIRFHKYPLYEAFDEVNQLLFYDAKKARNALAISLKKHSGQSAEFVVENYSEKVGMLSNKVPEMLSNMIDERKNGDFLKSVSTKIWQFKPLFEQALKIFEKTKDIKVIQNIFNNTFDSEIHKKYENELKETTDLLKVISDKDALSLVRELGGSSHKENTKKRYLTLEDKCLYALDALLRFVKFFTETGEEERDNGKEVD
jgi:CRISPR-associated protein Cmr2